LSAGGLYEQVLTAAGGALPARRPPRPSAAVVLWRRGAGGEVELFWLERGAALPFMGGWHAFPGGGVEKGDVASELSGAAAGLSAEQRTAASSHAADSPTEPDLVPGLVAAALRELAEETGVRLVVNGLPDASRLTFAGRWLTPPFTPVRFDNRFFLAEWRAADGEPRAVPPESAAGEWIAPRAALDRIAAGAALAAPPILHILDVLSRLDPEAPPAIERLIDSSPANLGPLRRIELRRGILLFPLATATLPPATHTNAFLLGTGESVLVDPGSADPTENERLLAALAAAESTLGRRVTAIWLTHHHPDHVAGVEIVRRALDVPVLAHRETAARLAGRGIEIDGELHDGERVLLAAGAAGDGSEPFAVNVLHTPGHARGHLAFEVESTRDLVAGDLVAGFGTIVIDPPEGDMTDYLDSLARLEARRPRTLFVAHGAPFLDGAGKLAEYRRHRLDREGQVLAALADGVTEAAAMVPRIYPEVPPAIVPLAERQVRAHLARLAALGRIPAGASPAAD
jgi:glyoxylase-like metal-dependent hydrolase (beta-lactamase superfamily II)/8-oxo-dGTP pyrophosphatase MutT (NUDIX family)